MPRGTSIRDYTSNRLNFRCTPEQEARWAEAIARAKLRDKRVTQSGWIRSALDAAALAEARKG